MEEDKNGKKAETGTQQYTFRIPSILKARLEVIADQEERSLSRQIILVLKNFVAEQKINEEK